MGKIYFPNISPAKTDRNDTNIGRIDCYDDLLLSMHRQFAQIAVRASGEHFIFTHHPLAENTSGSDLVANPYDEKLKFLQAIETNNVSVGFALPLMESSRVRQL